MNAIRRSALILLSVTFLPFVTFSQSSVPTRKYALTIVSSDSSKQNVSFSGAYAIGDSMKVPVLTVIEEKTPFTLNFVGASFVGLFQSKSINDPVSVRLVAYENDRFKSSLEGHSPLSVVHADHGALSYGWPPDVEVEKRH